MVSRKTCSFLFWSKVLFSLCFSCTALAFLSLRVYTKYKDAMYNGKTVLKKIDADATSAECQPDGKYAINEQPDGSGVYVGYSLDWSVDTPTTVSKRVNFRGAVWNAFTQLDPTVTKPLDSDMIVWQAQEIQKVGGIYQLTIEPVVVMEDVTDDLCEEIAELMYKVNFDMGVPVLLRYGHEMNGDWTVYGYKPAQYIAGFQKLAGYVHAKTNLTAMLWSPNVGINYPFTTTSGSTSYPPTASSDPQNFALLDTNGDGVLDFFDDPYRPYYPGDDYVDWVGLSLYYYQDDLSENATPSSDFLTDYIQGSGSAVDEQYGGDAASSANLSARNFYNNFVVEHSKPMILSESGAPYMYDVKGSTELEIKQAWWEQSWNTDFQSNFPRLKGIVNFEETKVEDNWKTWSLTNTSTIYTPYRAYMVSSTSGAPIFANNLEFSCSGEITVNV